MSDITERQFKKILQKYSLSSKLVLRALKQARKSHLNQRKHDGSSFFEGHILSTANEIINLYAGKNVPEHLVAAALLHDTVEDDPNYTRSQLEKDFPSKVSTIVKVLTKSPEENQASLTEEEIVKVNKKFLKRIKASSLDVQKVKLADRYNNIDSLESLKNLRPETYRRYVEETRISFLPFAKKVSPYFYKKLKARLEEFE